MRAILLAFVLSAGLMAAEPSGTYMATVTKAEGVWEAGIKVGAQLQIVLDRAAGDSDPYRYIARIGGIELPAGWIPMQDSLTLMGMHGSAMLTGKLILREGLCAGGAVNLAGPDGSAQVLEFEVR